MSISNVIKFNETGILPPHGAANEGEILTVKDNKLTWTKKPVIISQTEPEDLEINDVWIQITGSSS